MTVVVAPVLVVLAACFSHTFKVFMQNKNDMWIESLIIKIIRFFCCFFFTSSYGYVCSSIHQCVTQKIWWVANFLYKHSFIQKQSKATFLVVCIFFVVRCCCFRDLHKKVLGVLSACLCLAVKHFVSCTDVYFFAWKFTFCAFSVSW